MSLHTIVNATDCNTLKSDRLLAKSCHECRPEIH